VRQYKAFWGWLIRDESALTLAAAFALLVALGTLTPSYLLPPVPGSDKFHHFLAYGAIAFPIAFARSHAAVWIILGASAYGGLIEMVQTHVGRDGDIKDAVANTIGAICGTATGAMLRRIFGNNS
jgi:VanZ family protein